MSKLEKLSPELVLTMEEVIKLVAAGKTIENIARGTNLDVPTIDGLMGREEFHTIFRELDPKAYQRWVDNQADLTAQRAVKNMARADAVEHYKLYRDAVRAPDNDLKTHERLSHLWNLIKAGGVLDSTENVERVQMSEGDAENFAETLKELGDWFGREK